MEEDEFVFVSHAPRVYNREINCQPLKRLGSGRYCFPFMARGLDVYGLYNSSTSHHGECRATVHFDNGEDEDVVIMPDDYVLFQYMPSLVTFSKFQWCYTLFK